MSLQEHTIGWLYLIATVVILSAVAGIVAVAFWVQSVEDRLEAAEDQRAMTTEYNGDD